ncbi:ABC transporter substrate-binding protein [Rhodococcus sp. IEGM 1307]|uniref:ABC transporter substrate-binding protein n=1 Tax=Rhodococcus sp. IEGM 1307 TaxID=3047091 RepID=UPI0024B7FB12|nr:ABC transporter substrate-binding protein [Rhodococcus sp. IEGM 1307]MDI9978160.1 ABC transporter substrate-binding protein [Rhodococcus sp. IEGM 1307]
MTVQQSVFVVPPVVAVAQHRGLFAAAGVEVETKLVGSSHEQRRELDECRADVGITATDNLFAWNATGSDIAVIAQIETTTDLALTLRPKLPSTDGLDVIRLAVDAPTNGFAIVAYSMMARLGRTKDQYEIVEVGGVRERFESLIDNTADVTLLAPPLDEIGRDQGMTVAMRIAELVPSYPGLGIVSTQKVLSGKMDEIARYLRALAAAHRWMQQAAASEVEQELLATGLGQAAVASALAAVPQTLAPSGIGIRALAQLRDDLGMIVQGAPEAGDLIDLRPLQAAGLVPIHNREDGCEPL